MKSCLSIACAIVAATLPFASAADPTPAKPPVGVPIDAKNFHGKWYRVYLEKTTWRGAQEKCRTLGGQLACIHDAQTQSFVNGLAKNLELWLGANDEKVEGLWTWVDGKEMEYKAWAGREPQLSRKENYLIHGRDGKWWDARADWPCVGFVCEWTPK